MKDATQDAMREAMIRRVERVAPWLAFALALLAWETLVRVNETPPYILPAPSLVLRTLAADWEILSAALLVTLRTTLLALALATFGGLALALVFARWRWAERALFPFAVVLQVTPVIAIAPLLLVYLDTEAAVLACAFIVAFFPILSNAVLGLRSADRNLVELYALYRAGPWAQLRLLRLPSALPYFLGGLRIGGGLALIGAIVAEIAAGAAGKGAGLAFRIAEAGYRLNVPRMFAALALVSLAGIAIHLAFSLLSRLALRRWHDSEA
jgi:NitT/TauT family transport system permease protein